MSSDSAAKPFKMHLSVIIFFVCELLTVALWDHYFNSGSSLDRNIVGTMILAMGTLFAFATALFAREIESRRTHLEKEVQLRTAQLVEKEKEAQEEKERLAVTLRSIDDGVIAMDMRGSVAMMNAIAESLTGWKQAEARGKPLSGILKIVDIKVHEEYDVRNLVAGKNIDPLQEMVLVSKSGLYRFIAATSAVIRNAQGSDIGKVIAFRDITSEKMAELHLRWAEERYRTIFENSAVAITLTDEKERIVSWNKSTENLLEMNEKDLQARPVESLYPESEWKKLRLYHIRRKGMLKPIETKVVRKDGSFVDVELAVTILRNPEGEVTGSIGIIRDISERKAIDRLKDEFIRMTSHELRTPITVVREGVLQMVDGLHGETTEAQKSILSMLNNTVGRLSRMIDDLLDLSKIEAGRVELRRRMTDLTALAREVGSDFEALAAKKGLEIRYSFPGKNIAAYADRDKIVQVLTNLIGNAIKFTERGWVEVSGAEREGEAELCVSDSGRGIAEEDLPQVFGKFQQFGEQNNLPQKGTGLGLAISKGIVALHRGKIRVESRPGEGTKFTFSIPRYTARKLFEESVREAMKDSMNTGLSFSVLILGLEPSGQGTMSEIQIRELEKLIEKNVGFRGYVLRDGIEAIRILIRLGKETAVKIVRAIELDVAAFAEKSDMKIQREFAPKLWTFPEDASSEEEFLTKIF